MTVTESKGLKKGNRVFIGEGDATDSGTITEPSWNAVTIAWNNGQVAIVHHGDMREIERIAGKVGHGYRLSLAHLGENYLGSNEALTYFFAYPSSHKIS